MTRLAFAVALLAVIPLPVAGQQPDHAVVQPVLALFPESEPHRGLAGSWSKHVGRNWSLIGEYSFTFTTGADGQGHSDQVLWAGLKKSFGPLDDRVPYMLIGGAGLYRHTLYDPPGQGVAAALGVGAGLMRWNEDGTRFVAPEARIGINAALTISLAVGFRLD